MTTWPVTITLINTMPSSTLAKVIALRANSKTTNDTSWSIEMAKNVVERLVSGELAQIKVTVYNNASIDTLKLSFGISGMNETTASPRFNNNEPALPPPTIKEEPMTIEMKMTSPRMKAPAIDIEGIDVGANVLEKVMAAAMTSQVQGVIATLMPQISKVIQHEIMTNFVKRLEVKVNDKEYVSVGAQHKSFPDLLKLCLIKTADGSRVNTWMVGPAGTGKTTAAANVARAIEARDFGCIGTSDNKYELSGFIDAQGRVTNTTFKDIFVNGGVMLLDEIDSWYPNALLALQSALANNFCAFPDGVLGRHEDCIVICAANTFGQGEITEYVGRMKQDAAFLDRFVFLRWDIDEALERHISTNKEWVTRVQHVRRRINEKQIKVLVTPRASILGSALLEAGMPWAQVEDMVIRKAMTNEQWKSVQ